MMMGQSDLIIISSGSRFRGGGVGEESMRTNEPESRGLSPMKDGVGIGVVGVWLSSSQHKLYRLLSARR